MKPRDFHVLIAGSPEKTRNYENALTLLAFSHETTLYPKNLSSYDALLLPGGGDVNPAFYNERLKGSHDIDSHLDYRQLLLLHHFINMKKPVLGICKGVQVLNIYFGGTVIQHLPSAKVHMALSNGSDSFHESRCVSGTFTEQLYGTGCIVNSCHHQGCGVLGKGLFVSQYSEDSVIEAVCHKNLPVIGVQWHPERMLTPKDSDSACGAAVFSYLKTLM